MSAAKRSDLLAKIHKVLKKHYKPQQPPADRPLLEHLLYACCLENARADSADQAFAILQQSYFDWNEVRVTSLTELAEVMSAVPDPVDAAARVKGALQSVFEEYYAFSLEDVFKKLNLGEATRRLEKLRGPTAFSVAYVVQHAFGGHSIPVSKSSMETLRIVGAVTDKEASDQRVPGLERAIPKNKGLEFASLLQQLGADAYPAATSASVRTVLLEIAPDAKDRLPKRASKKGAAAEPAAVVVAPPAAVKPPKPAVEPKAPPKKTPPKPAGKAKPAASNAKKTTKKIPPKKPTASGRTKSDSKRISKRKPR